MGAGGNGAVPRINDDWPPIEAEAYRVSNMDGRGLKWKLTVYRTRMSTD
jgi:hypothetical protein